MDVFKTFAEWASLAIDGVGVLVIVIGLAVAIVRHARGAKAGCYRRLRHDVGRVILLGLEFMVAGDIIRTVAVEHTLEGVLTLGMVVLIRTFLSVTLEVELEGRWPWQKAPTGGGEVR